jgi:hypothetical protein
MSGHFQKEIAFLHIDSSPAFVRVAQANGYAERLDPRAQRKPAVGGAAR